MGKLTKPQRRLLDDVRLEGAFGYYTGNLLAWWRYWPFGGRKLRLLLSLHDAGLISVNGDFFATITPAGRLALEPAKAEGEG